MEEIRSGYEIAKQGTNSSILFCMQMVMTMFEQNYVTDEHKDKIKGIIKDLEELL